MTAQEETRVGRGQWRKNAPAVAARLVIEKIAYQFPDTPEGRLMLAVVGQAICDLVTQAKGSDIALAKRRAAAYLCGEIWHAQAAGVDPDFIRRVIAGYGLREQLQRGSV